MNKTSFKKQRYPSGKESGIALIITLALIVLVTVAAVAFFTRATSNRSVEASRANQILARQLAETGSDYTVGNFILEIVTNSTNNPVIPGNYVPTNDMVPAQLVSSNILPTNLLSSTFVNLLRQSLPPTAGQVAASPNIPFETNASSNDSTANPSENGRLVDTNRWSAPQLIPGGFTSTNQLPNWIYINRDGTLTNAVTTNDYTNIIGRFAYNAYDIGGLLDVNVAGYPPSVIAPGDTNMPVLKGTLAGADLTNIPGITSEDVTSFINWRNSNTANAAQSYLSDVTNAAAGGFLNAGNTNGDQFFASRQDLIRYATLQNQDFTNALPYLTHFTRELAAPSIPGITNTNRFALTNLSINVVTNITAILTNTIYFTVNANEYEPPNGDLGTPNWTDPDPNFKAMGIALNMIDQFNNGISTNPDTNVVASPLGGGNNITIAGKKALPYIARVYAVCNISPDPNNLGGFVCNGSLVPEVWIPPGGMTNCNILPQYNSPSPAPTITITATPASGNAPQPVVLTLQGSGGGTNSPNLVPDGTSAQGGWSENLAFATAPAPPYAASGFFAAAPGTIPPPPPPSPPTPGTSNTYTFTITLAINGLSFLLSTGDNTVNYNAFGLDSSIPPLASAPLTISASLPNLQANSDQNHAFGVAVYSEDPRTLRNSGMAFDFPGELDLSSATFGNDVVAAGLPGPVIPSVPYPKGISDTNYVPPYSQINSVGELGYVFRELPGRTIDFVSGINTKSGFNTNGPNVSGPWSADWQLLDFFSAYSAPTNSLGFPVRAGVLNLNTRQQSVLAAVLSGTTATNSPTVTNFISQSDATNIASNMVSMTTTNPWFTRAQLVDLVYSCSTNGSLSIGTDKQALESVVRALGEVGQVRTWNLLIDVIAQTGKFPATLQAAGSGSLGSQFIVGGEDRIWTSVAIDRFTGQVIDRQTEQVKQ